MARQIIADDGEKLVFFSLLIEKCLIYDDFMNMFETKLMAQIISFN